nr:hypothetical protein [Tanacetum cinerariifolium]
MKNIIRSDIRVDDVEGAACLLNEETFEGLARIGSTMASAIICLADNQKFNFLKYIFDNMVKSLEGGVKFYLFLTRTDSTSPTTDVIEDVVTMAQVLATLKNTKPKVVVQEREMSTTILAAATIVTTAVSTLRAKGIVFHEQRQSQIPLALVVGTTIVTIVAVAGIVVLISCSCTITLGFVLFNSAHA